MRDFFQTGLFLRLELLILGILQVFGLVIAAAFLFLMTGFGLMHRAGWQAMLLLHTTVAALRFNEERNGFQLAAAVVLVKHQARRAEKG